MFFGFSIYFGFNERDMSDIERFFYGLKKKISIYRHHLKLTDDLYKRELVESEKRLEKDFERNKKAGEVRYESALEEMGNSEYAEDYANDQSGLEEIYHYHDLDVRYNRERFQEVHSIFNKSALIGLYSLFEAESLKLSCFLRKHFDKRIGYQDLKSENYLKGYLNYFDLVLELDIANLSKFENKLNDLRIIRNKIVHENGDFSDSKNKLDSLVSDSSGTLRIDMENSSYTLEIDSIIYLDRYFEVIEEYFEQLFWEIDKKQEWPLLKEKSEYLFKFIDTKLRVESVKADISPPKRKVQIYLNNSSTDEPLEFKVDLILKKSPRDKIKVHNELSDVSNAKKFADNLYTINDILNDQIFNGFHFSEKRLGLEMKIYT